MKVNNTKAQHTKKTPTNHNKKRKLVNVRNNTKPKQQNETNENTKKAHNNKSKKLI